MSKMLQAVLTTAILAATPQGKSKTYCCTNPTICKAACGAACCASRITTAKQSVLPKPVLPQIMAQR